MVLSHILNCDRLSLYLNKDDSLTKDNSLLISRILKRRISGEPLQYILGKTEFMGREFKVDRRALIPRPETEILVESAVRELKASGIARPKILDLGTGSGCIAVSIAKLFPRAVVWAADISKEALNLAGENARLNKVKIKFLQTDIFSAFENRQEKFDLIISNPPYIPEKDLYGLAKEISFEPALALKAPNHGLDFYSKIIKRSAAYLKGNGLLALEVGINQSGWVKAMLEEKNFSDIRIIKDYNDINRVVIGKRRIK